MTNKKHSNSVRAARALADMLVYKAVQEERKLYGKQKNNEKETLTKN